MGCHPIAIALATPSRYLPRHPWPDRPSSTSRPALAKGHFMPDSIWLWIGFNVFVLLMLALDLGVFHRKSHIVSLRESVTWTVVWVALALLFNAGVWHFAGAQKALEFFTGYLIEKSLSVDNIFVFVLLFGYFAVPAQYQHKVLFWGILGALVMRAAMIALGAALIAKFAWIIYVFGAFLILTGIKMIFKREEEIHPERNPVVRLFRRMMSVTDDYRGDRFFVRENRAWFATPLFVVLLLVEFTDLIFAVDSIPAIFAVTPIRSLFTRQMSLPFSACVRCTSRWPESWASSTI
jgi:tellurite resistance protein TerC